MVNWSLLRVLDRLEEDLQVLGLVLQVVELGLPALLLQVPDLLEALLDGVQLVLEDDFLEGMNPPRSHLVLEVDLLPLQLHDLVLEVALAHLALQGLLHAEDYGACVECLVRREGHPQVVSHLDQQEA